MITCLEFSQTKKGQPRKTARRAYEKKRRSTALKKMGKGIEEKMIWYIYGKFGDPSQYSITDKMALKAKVKRDMAKFKISKSRRAFDKMFENYWLGFLFRTQHTDIAKSIGLPSDTRHIGGII